MQAGDVGCVVLGATAPFISRQDFSYHIDKRVVFSHGIMRGELLKLYNSEGFAEKVINICCIAEEAAMQGMSKKFEGFEDNMFRSLLGNSST